MSSSIARALVALVALVFVAWYALSAQQAIDASRAAALVGSSSSPAQLARAGRLLSSAKLLNPDRSLDVLQAQLALDEQHPARARSILERVVAAEPENAVAWEWLARASVDDLPEFYRAALALDQLVPKLPARR
jgi:predicted Zn-dependent protease